MNDDSILLIVLFADRMTKTFTKFVQRMELCFHKIFSNGFGLKTKTSKYGFAKLLKQLYLEYLCGENQNNDFDRNKL